MCGIAGYYCKSASDENESTCKNNSTLRLHCVFNNFLISFVYVKQNERSNNNKREEKLAIIEDENLAKLTKEKEQNDVEISSLKKELDVTKRNCELRCSGLEKEANEAKIEFEEKLRKLERLLDESKKKIRELETNSDNKSQSWIKKENTFRSFVDFQFDALRV